MPLRKNHEIHVEETLNKYEQLVGHKLYIPTEIRKDPKKRDQFLTEAMKEVGLDVVLCGDIRNG